MAQFARLAAVLLLMASILGAGAAYAEGENMDWYFGFGRAQILPDENSDQPLYIAGYHNGWEISSVLDYCEARAVWLDAGGEAFYRVNLVYQSTDQLRGITPLTLENPPVIFPLLSLLSVMVSLPPFLTAMTCPPSSAAVIGRFSVWPLRLRVTVLPSISSRPFRLMLPPSVTV